PTPAPPAAPDAAPSPPPAGSTATRSDARPDSGCFNGALFAHAFALQITFLVRRFHTMVAGCSRDGRDQWHGAVAGVDFVEAEKHARVKTLFDRADVSLDGLPVRNDGAIAGTQVLSGRGFVMLSRFD